MKKGKLVMVLVVALLMVGGMIMAGCAIIGCPSGRPNTSGYCSWTWNCGGSYNSNYYCNRYYYNYSCDC